MGLPLGGPGKTSSNSTSMAGLILAAGLGTRMRSAMPKVLHPVAGKPMVAWVLDALAGAGVAQSCAVVSEDRAGLEPFLAAHPDLRVAVQKNRRGTGDAVAAAAWSFAGVKPAPFAAGGSVRGAPIEARYVLISPGDAPAIQSEALRSFVGAFQTSGAAIGVLGMRVPDPKGYGRLVTRGDELQAIVEERDADEATRLIDICNTGIIAAEVGALFELLHDLRPENAQKEYYLTDCIGHARKRGLKTMAHVSNDWRDFAGINDRAQLAEVEAWIVRRKIKALMLSGVSFELPDTSYVEPSVEIGADTRIGSNCNLSGRTRIGSGCLIGAGSVLKDAVVPAGEIVPPLSVRLG